MGDLIKQLLLFEFSSLSTFNAMNEGLSFLFDHGTQRVTSRHKRD